MAFSGPPAFPPAGPAGGGSEPGLLDLLPAAELQRIQDAFSEAVGLASAILDLDGRPLVHPSGSCRLCKDFVRVSGAGRRGCADFKAAMSAGLEGEEPLVCRCTCAGLLDAAAPIRIRGRHVATWIMGQVRDGADPDDIPALAKRFEADPDLFATAWGEVPQLTRADFDRLGRMLRLFAEHVAELAYRNELLLQHASRQRRLERLVEHSSMHDSLTGLPNRSLFIERIRQLQRRGGAGGFAVIAIDLDDFSAVNDRYGHTAGDALLREAAERIGAAVRTADTVARIGGDEFAVLLESRVEPMPVARRIQAALRENVRLGGRPVCCEARFGIEISGEFAARPEDVLRNADMAMRQAKTAHRRISRFSPRLHEREVAVMDLAAALPDAIRDGQFLLHFQPIVASGPGTPLMGFEALMRWRRPDKTGRNPDGELIPPATFIPLAESSGHIINLGRQGLDMACAFAARLPAEGPPGRGLKVTVNVSPAQLEDGDFAADVLSALRRHDLPGERLVLEITESTALRAGQEIQDMIERIRAQGVGFCVDDFGVGYSNMSLLAQMSIDCLKIDISLVRGLETTPRRRVVVETILGMARTLGIHVVAEGVERRAQLETLRALGCDCCQGFLFAKPLPEEQALERAQAGVEPARPGS